MFVPLSPQTDKKGKRMNGVMNHRSGGGLQTMIMRTDPSDSMPTVLWLRPTAGSTPTNMPQTASN